MQLLLKNALIVDSNSSHHLLKKDVLMKDGKVEQIAESIENTGHYTEISSEFLCISKGWFDLNCYIPDPGQEHREDIISGTRAAASGGFTSIALMPNAYPSVQSKTGVDYVINKSLGTIVNVHPIGAITKDCKGIELTEMHDMYEAGAVAFSDGYKALNNSGMLLRSLEYVKAFDGIIFHHPEDNSISLNGQMNEGQTSVELGLHASPAIAESLCVARDLYLLEYTQSKLHFIDISTKESVKLIREAKARGLSVTASVNAYNLLLDDTFLQNFDTNAKVNPHLRTKEDVQALIEGIVDGTIDSICSAHFPHDEESKNLEFDQADYGMIGFETAFAVANTVLKNRLPLDKIIEKFTDGCANVLGDYCYPIEEGNQANMTIFDPSLSWVFQASDIKSKSKNTPFLDYTFTGKALGIINKKKMFWNDSTIK
jgi:dihydroorotase